MATETLNVRLLMQAQQYKREAREAATATGTTSSSGSGSTTPAGEESPSQSSPAE